MSKLKILYKIAQNETVENEPEKDELLDLMRLAKEIDAKRQNGEELSPEEIEILQRAFWHFMLFMGNINHKINV